MIKEYRNVPRSVKINQNRKSTTVDFSHEGLRIFKKAAGKIVSNLISWVVSDRALRLYLYLFHHLDRDRLAMF